MKNVIEGKSNNLTPLFKEKAWTRWNSGPLIQIIKTNKNKTNKEILTYSLSNPTMCVVLVWRQTQLFVVVIVRLHPNTLGLMVLTGFPDAIYVVKLSF